MPMSAEQIETHLREAFPNATVELVDLAGDNDHFQVTVVTHEFAGKSRVQQHKLVFDALKGKMGGELHALSVKTAVPDT